MKTASGTLTNILNLTADYLMADLYTVTLWDGTVYRWAAADTDLVLGGHTFSCPTEQGTAVPLVERGPTKCVAGLEVDTLDVVLRGAAVLLGGVALPLAAANGVFDGALVRLERVFMATWGNTTPGSVVLFSGFVAAVTPSSTSVQLSCKSDLERLLVAMPRNTFAPNCTHVLFDAGCALTRATYAVNGTVGGGATVTTFPTNLTQADGYFELGVLAFTSGALNGVRAAVRLYLNAAGTVTVAVTLPVAPGNGDTFTIVPGCDKTQATCTAKFSNLAHYRGFPFVPKAESTRGVGGA